MRKGPQTQEEWKQATTAFINDAIQRGESFAPGTPNFNAVQELWKRGVISGEVLTKVNNIAGIPQGRNTSTTGEIKPLKEFRLPAPRNIRQELIDAGSLSSYPIVQALSGKERKEEGRSNLRRIAERGGPATSFIANAIKGIPDAGASGIGAGVGAAIAGMPGAIGGGLLAGFGAPYIRNKFESVFMPSEDKALMDTAMSGLEERFPIESIAGQAVSSLPFGGATTNLGRTANLGRLIGGAAGAGIEAGQQAYDMHSDIRPSIDWGRIAGQFVANALVSGGRNTQIGDALEGAGFSVGRAIRRTDRAGNPLPGYEPTAQPGSYMVGNESENMPFMGIPRQPGMYHQTDPMRFSEFPFESRQRGSGVQSNPSRLLNPPVLVRPRGNVLSDPSTGDPIGGRDYRSFGTRDDYSDINVPVSAPLHSSYPNLITGIGGGVPGISRLGPEPQPIMPLQDPTIPLQGRSTGRAGVDPLGPPEPQVEPRSESIDIEGPPEPSLNAPKKRSPAVRVANKKAKSARKARANNSAAVETETVEEQSNQSDSTPAPSGVMQSGDDKLDFEYRIVPIDTVHGSHDIQGRPNPEYKGVQTRTERDSTTAIAALKNNLTRDKFNPTFLLADDPSGISGPPFVGQNMSSISGSGRIAMLKEIMSSTDAASQKMRKSYMEALGKRASELGITVPGGNIPEGSVLVRVNKTELDAGGLARVADTMNSPINLGKTAAEDAVSLARRAKEKGVFKNLTPSMHEDIAMLEVIRRMASSGVIPANELPKYVTSGGRGEPQKITFEGNQRISNMLIAAAYRDTAFLTKAANSPTTSKIVDAARRTALDIAVARSIGDPDMDITDVLATNALRGEAVGDDYAEYMRAKKSGAPGLLEIGEGEAAISAIMSDNNMSNSVQSFASFLKSYADKWKTTEPQNDGMTLGFEDAVSAAESKRLDAIIEAADKAGASDELLKKLDAIRKERPKKQEKSADPEPTAAGPSPEQAAARNKAINDVQTALDSFEDIEPVEIRGEDRFPREQFKSALESLRESLRYLSDTLDDVKDSSLLNDIDESIGDIDILLHSDELKKKTKTVSEDAFSDYRDIQERVDDILGEMGADADDLDLTTATSDPGVSSPDTHKAEINEFVTDIKKNTNIVAGIDKVINSKVKTVTDETRRIANVFKSFLEGNSIHIKDAKLLMDGEAEFTKIIKIASNDNPGQIYDIRDKIFETLHGSMKSNEGFDIVGLSKHGNEFVRIEEAVEFAAHVRDSINAMKGVTNPEKTGLARRVQDSAVALAESYRLGHERKFTDASYIDRISEDYKRMLGMPDKPIPESNVKEKKSKLKEEIRRLEVCE